VPAANLIGEENKGFRYIMENFNHERFVACVSVCSGLHSLIDGAVRYARKKTMFGNKRLIDLQWVRHKIAEIVMDSEALFAECEQLAWMMKINVPAPEIGPRIALCKVLASRTLEKCTREACQVVGADCTLREGQGKLIERGYREAHVASFGGGSEEVLIDLTMRMSNL
jgi:alkylation response protein AidB-like acyl-CoA dehydrogenase